MQRYDNPARLMRDMLADGSSNIGAFGTVKRLARKVARGAKAGFRMTKAVASNPLAQSLLTAVPGGAQAVSAVRYAKLASSVVKAAARGNPKALAAMALVNQQAAQGFQGAAVAAAAMRNVQTLMARKGALSQQEREELKVKGAASF